MSGDQDELAPEIDLADRAFKMLVAMAKERGAGPNQVANALMLAAAHALAHLCPDCRAHKLRHLTPVTESLVDAAIASDELLSGWSCGRPDAHLN